MGLALDNQVFADGLGQISVIAGTVRLDFVAYSPLERDPKGQPLAVFRQQIIMGVDGFLNAAGKINEAAQMLQNRVAAARPREAQPVIEPAAPQPASPEPAPEVTSSPVETPAPPVRAPFP